MVSSLAEYDGSEDAKTTLEDASAAAASPMGALPNARARTGARQGTCTGGPFGPPHAHRGAARSPGPASPRLETGVAQPGGHLVRLTTVDMDLHRVAALVVPYGESAQEGTGGKVVVATTVPFEVSRRSPVMGAEPAG